MKSPNLIVCTVLLIRKLVQSICFIADGIEHLKSVPLNAYAPLPNNGLRDFGCLKFGLNSVILSTCCKRGKFGLQNLTTNQGVGSSNLSERARIQGFQQWKPFYFVQLACICAIELSLMDLSDLAVFCSFYGTTRIYGTGSRLESYQRLIPWGFQQHLIVRPIGYRPGTRSMLLCSMGVQLNKGCRVLLIGVTTSALRR